MSIRKCIVSIKRQRMFEEEDETPDLQLNTSHVKEINESFSKQKKLLEVSCSGDSDSESDSSVSNQPMSSSRLLVSPVLGEAENQMEGPPGEDMPTESAPRVSTPPDHSPMPGPSHYEDITFEPPVTSTPSHGECQEDDEYQEEEGQDDSVQWDWVNPQQLKDEFEEGRVEVKNIQHNFLSDVQKAISLKSKVYLPQLRERRNKLSRQLRQLAKHKVMVDNLFRAVNDGLRQIDKEIDDVDYFVENFPNIIKD